METTHQIRIIKEEDRRSASHRWENFSKSSETRSSATHKLLSFSPNLSLASKIRCSAKAVSALKGKTDGRKAVSNQSCR